MEENKQQESNWLKYHLTDSTGILVESHPIYSAFEVAIAGMSNWTSIKTRLIATGMAYGGLGGVFGKGRDLSRKIFRITKDSSEKIQSRHDMAYNAVFNLIFSPPMYFLAGAKDWKEIAIGTLCATGFGFVNGLPQGYAIDIARDLNDLEPCKRELYPESIKRQSPRTKKRIATGLVAACIGTMSLIYSANSFIHSYHNTNQSSVAQKEVTDNPDLENRLR